MSKTLDPAYDPQKYEKKIYALWEKSGYFNPDKLPNKAKRKKSFTIVLPPPNVTGILHIGHSVMIAVEDLMIRFNRMKGRLALWLPGTDHAAIATQNVVERKLAKEGKRRYDLGREKFIAECWKWTKESRAIIVSQMKAMGGSLDWSREAFTMDEKRTIAVRAMFKKLWDDGLIVRGKRLVNWCARCQSTLADDEVEMKEIDGAFYYIQYPFKQRVDNRAYITIATTRPETMLADTAVAVNPQDERFKNIIGALVVVPLIGRAVRVISDYRVEKNAGTGALKVTPAHDETDYEIGQTHHLDMINILNPDGTLNDRAGRFSGLKIKEAREKVVEELRTEGVLEKIEPMKHAVGHCYRCNSIIEPYLSLQWFVDVNKKIKMKGEKEEKSFKDILREAVEKKHITILPERFDKVYFEWINNLRDWCISRQIWWGHQLPVWYCHHKIFHDVIRQERECGAVVVSAQTPKQCPQCGSKDLLQDPDTLDTWFSSALWPFSTLGWPNENHKDLKRFYPTDVLETAADILFFWVARMIMFGKYATGAYPFHTVYLHGIVRDAHGKKMSKSLGNIVNPLDVIARYGTDATRLSLIMGTAVGQDMNLDERKIEGNKRLINKIWNITRFVSQKKMNTAYMKIPKPITFPQKWICAEYDSMVQEVTRNIETYNYSRAAELLQEFTWHQFADWYLEIGKQEIGDKKLEKTTQHILYYILMNFLKLWHPFIPFVTEALWQELKLSKKMLLVEELPLSLKISESRRKKLRDEFKKIQEAVIALRNYKAQNKLSELAVLSSIKGDKKFWAEHTQLIATLARVTIAAEDSSASVKKGTAIFESAEITLLVADSKSEIKKIQSKI